MRPLALLPLALLASACVHQPGVDLGAYAYAPERDGDDGIVTTEVPVAWTAADTAAPPALPPSPRDKPRPDPIPFRLGAGRGALGHVDLTPCAALGIDPGYVHLRVSFDKSGRVDRAVVQGPTQPSPDALGCVSRQLEAVAVPRFDGSDVTLNKSLYVEDSAGEPLRAPPPSSVDPDRYVLSHNGAGDAKRK